MLLQLCVSSGVQLFSLCLTLLMGVLASSRVTWDFSIPGLPPASPLPLAPALLQLPRQPVSFSPLRANRVEQPGRRGRRGRESLEQSDRIAGAPAPSLGGSSVQLSFPKCLGRWGQRCLGEALLPFLMKRASWRRGAPPQAPASSN